MDNSESGFVEKRKEPRYACELEALIRYGRKRLFCRITNISLHGLEIRTDKQVDMDEFIIEFKVDKDIFALSCQIVSLIEEEIESVIHAKFVMIPTETRKYFENFLTYATLSFKKL